MPIIVIINSILRIIDPIMPGGVGGQINPHFFEHLSQSNGSTEGTDIF